MCIQKLLITLTFVKLLSTLSFGEMPSIKAHGIRELMIYDVSGRLVERRSYETGNSSITDTVEDLSPGVYHIVAIAGKQKETLKICIIP